MKSFKTVALAIMAGQSLARSTNYAKRIRSDNLMESLSRRSTDERLDTGTIIDLQEAGRGRQVADHQRARMSGLEQEELDDDQYDGAIADLAEVLEMLFREDSGDSEGNEGMDQGRARRAGRPVANRSLFGRVKSVYDFDEVEYNEEEAEMLGMLMDILRDF